LALSCQKGKGGCKKEPKGGVEVQSLEGELLEDSQGKLEDGVGRKRNNAQAMSQQLKTESRNRDRPEAAAGYEPDLTCVEGKGGLVAPKEINTVKGGCGNKGPNHRFRKGWGTDTVQSEKKNKPGLQIELSTTRAIEGQRTPSIYDS